MEEVAYVYSETREGDTLQSFTKDFSGFWCRTSMPPTMRIQCPQQKCLIHLIRDLNERFWNIPMTRNLKTS